MDGSYPQSRTNKIRQLPEKASYDRQTIHRVLDAGLVAQVAFIQDAAPVVVPMIYGRDGDIILLHGARKARVIRLLEETGKACLNVTLLDGLVLARSAFSSSMEYRSVTVFGTPRLVEGSDAKVRALRIISEHTMPGRWDELREPHDREVKMTGVIALEIDTASAKISDNGVDDEDDDYQIPIWAGVLPITSSVGSLVDDERLLPGVEPSDIVRALQNRKI
jgi:nitroimidazol reductase NimA-like FMN-containing flavoprotein (pyridoxamine 5'-phosphate oxidase superfamily)